MMRLSLLAVAPMLGVSELIVSDVLRLITATIAAVASVYAAWAARQGSAEARRTRREVRRRRRRARHGDRLVIVDEPDPGDT